MTTTEQPRFKNLAEVFSARLKNRVLESEKFLGAICIKFYELI